MNDLENPPARPDEVEILPLSSEDEPIVGEMLYHAIHVPEGEAPPPPSVIHKPELRRYAEGWGRVGDWGVKAIKNGRTIGAAWVRTFPETEKGYGWVAGNIPELSIAVLPGCRGKGVGTRLLEALLDRFSATGTSLSLSVSKGNLAANWYERFGFRSIADDGAALTMVRVA